MLKLARWSTVHRCRARRAVVMCGGALCAGALCAWAPPAAGARPPSALVVFVPAGEPALARAGGLSVGILSATQGSYSTEQFLLDATQGARVAASAYARPRPPALAIAPAGGGAVVSGWRAARRRAEKAPQLLDPGLLAASVPGGGAYAGVEGEDDRDAILAADRGGRIAAYSRGPARTLLARVSALRGRNRLVVADLPAGARGLADLAALARARAPGELLVVIQRVPDRRGGELLWTGAGGLAGGPGHELTSDTTRERGLISAVDLAPTILLHLGAARVPSAMRGEPIRTSGALRSAHMRSLMSRLRVIGGRRLRALGILLCAWALLLLAGSPWPSARARALRVGALAVLWTPVAVLLPAVLEPGPALEYATITLLSLALAALSDALLPWPRAPLAPALAAVLLLSADQLAGTQLLMRSLLGPNPILGARFYGIGNELKSGLAVLVLAGVAAVLYPSRRGRRAVVAMLAAGAVLAVMEGAARIGAGVGGAILVSAGFAVACVLLLEGAPTRRRALIVVISPLVALVALAGIDLASAHGTGHYTGSILHARSAGDLRDVIVRRYKAAWGELHNHAMPAATAFALAYAIVGVLRRERLLAPVGGDPGWLAALAGGLTAGVVGALAEDSGPVLLVVAVFALGCVASYLWGRPSAPTPGPRPSGRPRRGG